MCAEDGRKVEGRIQKTNWSKDLDRHICDLRTAESVLSGVSLGVRLLSEQIHHEEAAKI